MRTYTIIYKTDKQNEYFRETFTPDKYEKFMKRVTKGGSKIEICAFSVETTQMKIF